MTENRGFQHPKIGLSHTPHRGLSHTPWRGLSHTDFNVLEEG